MKGLDEMAYRKVKSKGKLKSILVIVCILAVSIIYYESVKFISKSGETEDFQRLETAIKRASVACYACEGKYPDDLSYLIDHYGLQIDEEKYTVYYECIADNLIPDITVLENDRKGFDLDDEAE